MANLRDRGYSSSMDNYNQQQEKKKRQQEQRKQNEATNGPVSAQKAKTLSLPKVNSTANSRAASQSAPIQTQRFYDPNVTRAAPGTGGGRGTPHITEQEFNRSTAMTRSYGNYSNYLNGIHVTGSGFADPDILFRNEPNFKEIEAVQNQFDQALNVVSGDFEKKASDYERWYRTITNQNQPMSDAQKAQGDQLYADYMKSLDAYQKMSEAYMKASASNANIYANASSQRQKWYDSIRDEKDIDIEEKDLMSQLDLLEDQKYKVQSESSYAKTQTLHGITTAQGLETVMNSSDELDRLDRQIDEVKAQLEILNKERAYSRYFKWQELANNNMPVSARRMQGGAPSWLDKIISGTATEEEIMQAINEGNINPSNIAEMLDDEKQTYRAIYQQYGPAKAKEYVDELERYGNIRDSLNTRRRMTDETKLRNWVQKGSPFGRQFAASLLTVLASPTKVLSYVGQGADYLFSGEMTKDADYNVFSYAPNAVTAQIGENITKWGEEHGSKWVQKWGEFGYQTALSILTFLYTTALTGGFGLSPETMFGVELYNQGYRTAEAVSAYKAFKTAEALSLGLMGTEAAADAVMQAKDRGLDDGQAFWMGTAAGAIEILTEKFSVENLLEGVGDRSRLLSFLKSMFTEGSEEVASDLSNMIVDSLVAKDKSEFNQSVKNYMKEYGVSKQEALKAVWTEQLKSVGLSGLGGAISGGFMGGANIVRSGASNLFNRSAITSQENVANIIGRAQGLNEWSEGARSASALQRKLDAGERFTIREVLKARNAIETDRKTDPKYVGALIEAAQDYGDSDAKKQADKLQTKLDNGKVKVEDVEKLEEAIDLERLVDPNREDLQTALKYGETADQKSEAYKLTKGIRDKIAAGEKLSLEEVSAAESAVNTAKATSAEGLKSTIESGLASDQNSPAYKSAQQLQSKLDSGTEITLAEVNEAKRAVRAAENAAYKSLDPNVVGKYLVTENGRKALTDAATILKNSTSQSDIRRGNEMLQAIKDGSLDAKTAGEVFLRSQKILENTRNQTSRVLQPREVTADMDAYDRSAAELGISEEEASRNKSILQAFGVEGEYKSFENNNLSAYYDRSTGKVYINANAQNPGLALIAHEVTHSFENTAGYKKLADLVFSQSKDLNADLQRITQEYADAGINLDDEGARSELVSEFVEQHMFNDEKFINDVVTTDRTLGQKFLSAIDNLLAKLGNKNAQQRQLLREARDLWAEALQQRKKSDKAKAKIAEKRSNGKLTLPAVEAKAAAVRKTEGPKNLSLSRANDGVQAGIRQAVLTAGIDISRDSSGKLVFKIGGESVDHVTAEHIRDSSAFGAMISLARDGVVDNEGNTILKGHITEDEANEQYQAVADLMNTVMTTQNPEMVWELAGSQMFAAVKSNSDGQYGTTVDFTTVCRKTQEMITAMSERMMAKKGGLTKAEVIELQADLIEANLNVPCPVCYVFSRWAGVGTLLDNMYKFQHKYANMTDAELAEAIERLRARDKKADRARLRSDLRNPESAEFDEAYYDLVSTRERLRADNKALRKQLKTAEKNGIQADIDSLSKSIAFNNDSIKNLDKQIKDIENAADTAGKELVWLEKVRTKATYKAVPAEILFNMADGEAIESFMRDYPDSWNYRTTRGPAMGKAITPYSDMRLGDLFMSLKSNSAAAFAKGRGNVFSNPLGVKGKFNKKQMNEIVKAIARTRAQNLIGGQRFQSTSDFRYDYALDYIQTFFEAQALGSNMQTYTKIIEFGEMVAKIGGDVNLSVMPRNKGYEGGKLTYSDGNYSGGTLIYSNVTGINFGAAKLLSEKYDSAQLILVGINDDHIRLALNDTTDTGGAHVGFVIPYHASGASIDTFIRELVKNLNEEFKRENYTDYSTVQTDTEKAGATALQRRLRDLRKAILTGNRTILQKAMDENGRQAVDSNGDPKFTRKTIPWIPKRSEIDFLRDLAKNKTDITGRSFEDLLDVERRALQGDPEAIRDYESWSADLLLNLYKKMWTKNGAENGVRLNSSQAAAIMPHEYWDTNSTRDMAYLNNFIFRSYCYNLGLNPRFTGIDSKGNVVDFGDFSDCRGYWKTLIDRAMYDNNGNYRAQQPINMSRLEVGMIQEEEGRKAWGDAVVKKPDVAKAREIGRQVDGKLSLPKAESKQFAKAEARWKGGEKLTESQFYSFYSAHKLDLRRQGNVLEQIESIKRDGFKGTGGFTGNLMPTRQVTFYPTRDKYNMYLELEKDGVFQKGTAEQYKSELGDEYGRPEPSNASEAKYGPRKGEYILLVPKSGADMNMDRVKPGYKPRYDYEIVQADYDYQPYYEMYSKAYDAQSKKQYAISKSDTAYLNAVESGDMETAQRMVDDAARKAGYTVKGYHGTSAKFTIFDKSRSGQNWHGDSRYGPGLYFAHDAKTASKWTDGSRIVDAWLSIQKPIDLRKDAPEDIVKAIKERTKQKATQYEDWFPVSREQYLQNLERNESYDIKNVGSFLMDFKYDKNGKMTDGIREFLQGLGYDGIISDGEIVVFDPSQVKSADPVTYDDSGKPIPLSERFNPENDDIRYAINKAATLYRTENDFSEPMPIDQFRDAIKKESAAEKYFPKGLSENFIKAISKKSVFNKTKLYRGMDANEMDFLIENKFLKSNGSYNFSNQQGQTLGDEDPGYALSYATWYAPEEIADKHYEGGSPSYLVEFLNSPDLNVNKNSVQESYTYDNIDQKYITRIFEITYDQDADQDVVVDVTDDMRSMLPDLGSALSETAHGQPMFYQDKTTGTILYAAQGNDGWENGRYISQYDADNNFGKPIVFSYDQIKDGTLTRHAMRMFKISGNESDLVPMKIGADGTLEVDDGNNSAIRYAINKDATIRTEGELIDSIIDPKETAKAGVENALDSYLDSIGAGSDIPGMDKISTGTKRNAKLPAKYKAQDAARFFYRKMVDSGEAVTRLGRYSNDPHLYHYYNMARASSNAAVSMIQDAQTDVMGRRVGDSLNDIFSAIRKKGDQYYADLQAYLFHTHNIDRMSRENPGAIASAQAELEQFRHDNPELANMADFQIERLANDPISFYHDQARAYMQILRRLQQAAATHNKPVFGQEVSAEQSRRAAEDLREKLSETEGFEEDVEKIYAYIDNLMQYRIDSGLITEEEYQRLKEIYPHYVPTFREQEPAARNKRGNTTEIGKTVGRAQGGDTRLIPLHRALAQQTFSVVREGSKNRFGQMLLEGKQNSSRGMIKNVEEAESGFHEDTFDEEDPTPTKENTFIVRQGGKRYEIGMDNALYEAVTALSPEPAESNFLINMVHKSNDLFKALCTGYNPTFLVRNFMRDLQDAGLYSKDLSEFSKNYPLAYKEIASNGKYWQMYKALGGLYSSFFDYQTGELKQSGKVKKYTVDAIESVNMAVEQAPRLAEFMATVKKAEKAGNLSMDTLMEAIYNAADVTVNFGRSGKWGKMFNRSVVPFFNPGVQGFDKMIRNVTETKGFKDWARLAAKATILGIAPAVISRLLFGKRKDWDEIKQRDKDIYYLFPLQDGVWLKLPKGRVLSVFGMAADRAMQGKDADWASFIETSLTQTAPENPLTASYWRPWLDAKLFDKDDPGKTWYGSDIENQRLRNLAPGQRYDTTTDALSKWLGKTFNLSPRKINYLLDQYSGVIGDVLLPLTSDRAEKGLFTNAFTIDSVVSNQLSEDFYDMKDRLTWAKNDPNATGEDEALYKYWNEQTSAISDINKAIRAIEQDKSLTDKEKRDLTRVQYSLRNGIMRNALDSMSDYRAGGTDNDIYSKVSDAQAQEERESKTYNFKGQDVAWDDLSGTQKKIVQAQDAIDNDPNADLSEIIGKGNATKKLAQYQAARDQGISNQTYIDALQAIDDADDGNGNYNQAEAKAGLDKLISDGTISEKEAGTLWKIITGGADKNNPFPVGAIGPIGLRLPKIG